MAAAWGTKVKQEEEHAACKKLSEVLEYVIDIN
jgi:hypothetical protein